MALPLPGRTLKDNSSAVLVSFFFLPKNIWFRRGSEHVAR